MQDRIVANTLEEATSTDFNAAQQTQARRLSDALAAIGNVVRPSLPDNNSLSYAVPLAAARVEALIQGLEVFVGDEADRIYVLPGSLTQTQTSGHPLTGPAWVSGEVSDPVTRTQTGILRDTTAVLYASTAGLGLSSSASDGWHLLCVRLKPVVTLAENVPIFDVASQSFVSTPVTKRVELQLEFQWVMGTPVDANTTALPNLDSAGEDWEPLAYVAYATGGSVTIANRGRVIDVARRAPSGRFGSPGLETFNATPFALATKLLARLSSARSPDTAPAVTGTLAGVASSDLNGEQIFFASGQDSRQHTAIDAVYGTAPADWGLVHFYLCPLQGTSRRRWPTKIESLASVTNESSCARGLVVATTVQPTRNKTNSAQITLYATPGNRGKWINQDYIPEGYAQYLGSGHARGNTFYSIYPMVQTSGGSVLYQLGEEYYSSPLWYDNFECLLLGSFAAAGSLTTLNRSMEIDLTNWVPHCATVVYLHVQIMGYSDFGMVFFEVRNRVNDVINTIGGPPAASTGGASSGSRLASACLMTQNPSGAGNTLRTFPDCVLRVPVGWVPPVGHGDADLGMENPIPYHLRLIMRQFADAGTTIATTRVHLLGWDT